MFREHLGLSTEIWIGRVRGSYLVSFICCDFIFIYFCFALFVFGLCPVPTIPRVFGLSILNCLFVGCFLSLFCNWSKFANYSSCSSLVTRI